MSAGDKRQPRNHAPWCRWDHEGPCPAENAPPPTPRDLGQPLIAVEMGEEAAQKLATACQWASYRAIDRWDDESLPTHKREEAEQMYEWLSWGSHWLTNPGARR